MIDTIELMVEPPDRDRCGVGREVYQIAAKLAEEKKYRTLRVRLTKGGYLIVGFSIPSVLYGTSITEYCPIDARLLEQEVFTLFQRLQIDLDPRMLRVCRLDICRNIPLSRPAAAFICHVARYSVRRADTVFTNPTSTLFRWSKYRSLQFYDKLNKEFGTRNGRMLRIELRLGNTEQVKRHTRISTFNDVLGLLRKDAEEILHRHVLRLIGSEPPFYSPDPEAVWREAGRIVNRGTAGYFLAIFLSVSQELTPVDFSELSFHLKSHLSKDRFREERDRLLRPISVGAMDKVFRDEVVKKIISATLEQRHSEQNPA